MTDTLRSAWLAAHTHTRAAHAAREDARRRARTRTVMRGLLRCARTLQQLAGAAPFARAVGLLAAGG
jgi:hypothetical protein